MIFNKRNPFFKNKWNLKDKNKDNLLLDLRVKFESFHYRIYPQF